MKVLSEIDLEHILLGCTVLGTGGGGDLKKGLERVRGDLKNGKVFKIISLDEVPDEALVASPYFCGSLTASNSEDKTIISEDLLAFRALQAYFREDFFGVVSTELGGGNTAAAMSVAANLDIPIVDGDPAGRSVPELQHTTFYTNGVSITPLSVGTGTGDVIIVKEAADHFRAEAIVRAIAVASGAHVGVTDHPVRGKKLKTSLIPNAITYAEKIGAMVKRSMDYREVAKVGGGYILFRGKVDKFPWKDEGGFTIGEIYIQGTEEYQGEKYKIWFKNENLMSWRNEEIDIMTPDLICILSIENAMPIINPNFQEGMNVVVIGYPAPQEWRTKKGLETLGPKSFGFDYEYSPIEDKKK